jgi:hypothetical protein
MKFTETFEISKFSFVLFLIAEEFRVEIFNSYEMTR